MPTPVWIVLLVVALIAAGLGGHWLVRQCERVNRADWGRRWLNRLDGLNRIFCRTFHRLPNVEIPLPPSGPALIASNHVSGLDPLLLIAASPRPLRFLIAREEYDRWWLKWLFRAIGCIPVERHDRPRAALYAARKALEAGEVVALFPHGHIHLGQETSMPLKRGVVLLSRMTGAPIIPVRVQGVRGQGLTLIAVFLPSRACLECFPPLSARDKEPDDVFKTLMNVLSRPRHDATP